VSGELHALVTLTRGSWPKCSFDRGALWWSSSVFRVRIPQNIVRGYARKSWNK